MHRFFASIVFAFTALVPVVGCATGHACDNACSGGGCHTTCENGATCNNTCSGSTCKNN